MSDYEDIIDVILPGVRDPLDREAKDDSASSKKDLPAS